MKVFFFNFLFVNSCRLGLDGYYRKLGEYLDLVSIKGSSNSISETEEVSFVRYEEDELEHMLKRLFICMTKMEFSPAALRQFVDESEWVLETENTCFEFCNSPRKSECMNCWENTMMTSPDAYNSFCQYFGGIDCSTQFSILKFRRKARNCLARHAALDIPEEEIHESQPVSNLMARSLSNSMIANTNDPLWKSMLRCLDLQPAEVLQHFAQSQWFGKNAVNCNAVCESGSMAWRCSRCWKNAVLTDNEPYVAYCRLPRIDCRAVNRAKFTQRVNNCLHKLAEKRRKAYIQVTMFNHGLQFAESAKRPKPNDKKRR